MEQSNISRKGPLFCSTYTLAALFALLLSYIVPIANVHAGNASDKTSLETGKQIYLQGTLPSGEVIRSFTQGDVELPGSLVSCVNCHQRSGMGSSESRIQVPPINEDALFKRKEIGRSQTTLERFKTPNSIKMSSSRMVYTDASLRKAIVDGIDPEGRKLNPLMPRYALDQENLDHLITYMRSLSRTFSPGVTDDTIYFSTIIAGEVDEQQKQSMLNVINTYFEVKNANTRNETGRAKKSPWHKEPQYTAYRKWKLDIWNLSGPPDTWKKQLGKLYKDNPVFAVLGGINQTAWNPIHDFCESNKIPCLLPNTRLPKPLADEDFYTVYFSKGLALEAKAMAHHITGADFNSQSQHVVQVYRKHESGSLPASVLTQSLRNSGFNQVTELALEMETPLDADFWTDITEKYDSAIIVAWLTDTDIPALHNLDKNTNKIKRLYLSSTLINQKFAGLPEHLNHKLYLSYPYELPAKRNLSRIKAWARLKKIKYTSEEILANSYFLMTLTNEAVKHIQSNLYRDYFLERIEHMTDSMITSSIYPRASLGPGQRHVSKGSYIVQLDKSKKGAIKPVTNWIIP